MNPRPHRTWCDINLATLRANARFIRRQPGCGAGLLGVVKANAYGHGLLPVAQALQHAGAAWLGTANLDEALTLRQGGITLPILLLSAPLPSEIPEIVRHGFVFTWSTAAELRAAARAAAQLQQPARGFLKTDTGMGRLGCFPHQTQPLLHLARSTPGLLCLGLSTHYASADEAPASARAQHQQFLPYLQTGLPHHTSNSAATLRQIDPTASFARVGLALYGCSPLPAYRSHLRPVLSWKARITSVRTFPKGWPISYGSTYRTRRNEQIAVVAVGYGDGLFRRLSPGAHVLLRGQPCPIRGRITMDQIMIDVSSVPNPRPGDPVTLIGQDGPRRIRAEDLARWADTIPYEILTHIQGRVTRHFLSPSPKNQPSPLDTNSDRLHG
ncbi:MAG: alanine racemase [Verrucomicrobiia bacterium]